METKAINQANRIHEVSVIRFEQLPSREKISMIPALQSWEKEHAVWLLDQSSYCSSLAT